MPSDSKPTAEQAFREAFERLKVNKPIRIPLNSPVSQNNVAREAAVDSSALRKSRYPRLILEIQAFVEIQAHQEPTPRQANLLARRQRADLKERLREVATQRDCAQSQLLSAHRAVLELLQENAALKIRLDDVSAKVSPLDAR